jgi:glucokinase
MKKSSLVLVGDIGGTNTRLALFSKERGLSVPLAQENFPSADYDTLMAVIIEFLSAQKAVCDAAAFAIAGPIKDEKVQVTNIPWKIDGGEISSELGDIPVKLLNDLVGMSNIIPLLSPAEQETLNQGQKEEGGAIAVVAPGTGLGEAFLLWDGEAYVPRPSEGGHTDFAPTTTVQIELLEYLQDRHEHISYERVCSGLGIPRIYDFYKSLGTAPEPDWLAQKLETVEDPTPVIIEAAVGKEKSELAQASMKMFVSILGAEAGNLALKVLATGGVYIGGGIPPRILPLLKEGFMASFLHKGRFNDLLQQMPVRVILHSQPALFGVAKYGLEKLIKD